MVSYKLLRFEKKFISYLSEEKPMVKHKFKIERQIYALPKIYCYNSLNLLKVKGP